MNDRVPLASFNHEDHLLAATRADKTGTFYFIEKSRMSRFYDLLWRKTHERSRANR